MKSAFAKVELIQVEAVKILADGTQVPLGVIGYWHRNPLRRAWFRLKQFLKGAIHG